MAGDAPDIHLRRARRLLQSRLFFQDGSTRRGSRQELLTSPAPTRWSLSKWSSEWAKLQLLDERPDQYDNCGFRVPVIIVSPYAKAGSVSHTEFALRS